MSDAPRRTSPLTQRGFRRPWYAPWVQVPIEDTNIDMRRAKSMVASAARITSEKIRGSQTKHAEAWMGEAWTMYDIVGELHFLATTLARRAARARFYIGKVDGSDVIELEAPTTAEGEADPNALKLTADELKEQRIVRQVFDSLGDGFIGLQEIVERAFLNQYVVGAAYLVGAPDEVWKPQPGVALRPISTVPVGQLTWKTLSVTEFVRNGDSFELRQNGSTTAEKLIKIPLNAIYSVLLWTPHPSDLSVPDSPVRAALPILRELVGLTQHISAQIDSRLAGAGMLVTRSSHSRALKRAMNLPEDDASDPLTSLLIDSMTVPISDRDSASAVVPFIFTIPDESSAPEYLSFSSAMDEHSGELREESIRRLALSLDSPPELLLGQGSTSHWTAWLTQEEVVDSHISPTLALLAREITRFIIRPILRANSIPEANAEKYAVWYDTSNLTVKANMSADGQALFQLGVLSEEALLRAAGFDESDAPKKADVKEQAIDIVKEMVVGNPGLMNRPGLDVLVEQITALLEGTPKSGIAAGAAAKESSGSAEIAPPAAPAAAPAGPAALPRRAAPAAGAAAGGAAPAPLRGPSVVVTEPGLPATRAAAAATSLSFGTWDKLELEGSNAERS